MLRLLDDAASRAREAGRRLLLVIDGLDEDGGTATGPSIAALLPRRPPSEVRVLVASRPHPPIPDDVADDHPLRTISPRQLAVFEHARDIERRTKHELTQLLTGEQLQRDVLGLIAAAGGGVTLGDLEQLTEQPPFEIEHLLGGVFGRSVGSRTGTASAGYPDERVYLFTHETLRLVAEQQYGNSLGAYRDRLHTWADTYQQRGWPGDTPHYLLRSYPRMLACDSRAGRAWPEPRRRCTCTAARGCAPRRCAGPCRCPRTPPRRRARAGTRRSRSCRNQATLQRRRAGCGSSPGTPESLRSSVVAAHA